MILNIIMDLTASCKVLYNAYFVNKGKYIDYFIKINAFAVVYTVCCFTL